MSGEALDHGCGSCRGGGPHEEHGSDTSKGRFERCGNRDIAFDDVDTIRERRALGPARECGHSRAGAQKLVDDEAPDPSRCTGDENGFMTCVHHATESVPGAADRARRSGVAKS